VSCVGYLKMINNGCGVGLNFEIGSMYNPLREIFEKWKD
jgi:hypothetical protein